jgi:hypothetical protein
MLVSKKSRLLPPPSDRILRSAQAESKRLIGSGEESFEPITTSLIINIASQIMEGSPPLNADSIFGTDGITSWRTATTYGIGEPSPMLPSATECATAVSAISSTPRTTSASGASYRSNDATSGVTYSGTCKFTTYGYTG